MKTYKSIFAKQIIVGCHLLESISDPIRAMGNIQSVLIITQGSMKRAGFLDLLVKQIEKMGILCFVNIEVKPEPTIENIENIYRQIERESIDLLIGFGGGSVLDATKILSVMKTNNQTINEMLGVNNIKRPGIPMILIPTTSGTGSEVTPNAIITIPEEKLKIGVVSQHLLPDLALLDPVVTVGLPQYITAATGMDSFTHAFESFISNKANMISNMFALESMRLINESILQVFHYGEDLRAREKMMIASMFGGMALTSAGTAAIHALAYPLGGSFNISHGVANAMLLPHVTEFNLDAIEVRLFDVAKVMVVDSSNSKRDAANNVLGRIIDWTKELKIPQKLENFGVSLKDVPNLAKSASKITRLMDNNPKKMTIKDIESVYQKLF